MRITITKFACLSLFILPIILSLSACSEENEALENEKKEETVTNIKKELEDDFEIINVENINEKPEIDYKLERPIDIYSREIEGDISEYVDGDTYDITVKRMLIDDVNVEYIFYLNNEEIFHTPQIENANAFEYIQFLDIDSDDIPEILIASYVQNRIGYEVQEFYIYKQFKGLWTTKVSYNMTKDNTINQLLGETVNLEAYHMDVDLITDGIEIILSDGKEMFDEDGKYWEWTDNYRVIMK